MAPKQILWRSYIIEEDGKDKEIDIPQPILDYIQDIVNDEDFEIIDLIINTEDDLWELR